MVLRMLVKEPMVEGVALDFFLGIRAMPEGAEPGTAVEELLDAGEIGGLLGRNEGWGNSELVSGGLHQVQ